MSSVKIKFLLGIVHCSEVVQCSKVVQCSEVVHCSEDVQIRRFPMAEVCPRVLESVQRIL